MMMNENQQAIKTDTVEQKASDRFNAKEQIKKKNSLSAERRPLLSATSWWSMSQQQH